MTKEQKAENLLTAQKNDDIIKISYNLKIS